MDELMLIENPLGMNNPIYVAPYRYRKHGKVIRVPGYIKNYPGVRNPKGGKKKMRNPKVPAVAKEWFQGADLTNVGSAIGGIAAATYIPPLLVTDTSTTGKKVLKFVACLGSAAGAGFVMRNISAQAGKYAVIGGLASAVIQGLAMFTGVQIGRPPIARPITRQLGESRFVPGPNYEDDVQVSVT